MNSSDRKYISDDDSTFLRLCRLGQDLYVGKLIHENLTTDRVEDIRRNIVSIVHRIGTELRVPVHLKILACNAAELRSLAWSPTGTMLAVGTRYGTIQVWDVARRVKLHTVTELRGDVCWKMLSGIVDEISHDYLHQMGVTTCALPLASSRVTPPVPLVPGTLPRPPRLKPVLARISPTLVTMSSRST